MLALMLEVSLGVRENWVKILCGIRNAEFDHIYFAELQVQNVRLSVGGRELL